MTKSVDQHAAEVVHDELVRALNLDPAQVRAGAFSVGWERGSSDVTVTWDGVARLPAEVWDAIAAGAGLTDEDTQQA